MNTNIKEAEMKDRKIVLLLPGMPGSGAMLKASPFTNPLEQI